MFCYDCNKSYSTTYNLNKHLRVVHKKNAKYIISYAEQKKYMCVECNLYFQYNNDLRRHLEEHHNFENIIEELLFDSYEDFTGWKTQEEVTNNLQYVRDCGKKKCGNDKEKIYFECKSSYRKMKTVLEENRKRKSKGSCKMPISCASQIIVTRDIETDKCYVVYYRTHYMHNETNFLSLSFSNEETKNMKEKIRPEIIYCSEDPLVNEDYNLAEESFSGIQSNENTMDSETHTSTENEEFSSESKLVLSGEDQEYDGEQNNERDKRHVSKEELEQLKQMLEGDSTVEDNKSEQHGNSEDEKPITEYDENITVKEEIKSMVLQLLHNLETSYLSLDQLQLIFKHTKSCLRISKFFQQEN